jgi:hypothetical protein
MEYYDSSIVELAILTMLKHIISSGDSARLLINALVDGTYDETVYIFSGVLRLWLECVSKQVQPNLMVSIELSDFLSTRQTQPGVPQFETEQTSYDREKERFIRRVIDVDNALHNFIKFATEVADESHTLRSGMLAAGCLALVLFAFANQDFKLPGLLDISGRQGSKKRNESRRREPFQPLSLSAINTDASTLSDLIRSPKFRRTWQGRRFETRLALCSSLVHTLLKEDGSVNDRYAMTHSLFNKIVAVDS